MTEKEIIKAIEGSIRTTYAMAVVYKDKSKNTEYGFFMKLKDYKSLQKEKKYRFITKKRNAEFNNDTTRTIATTDESYTVIFSVNELHSATVIQ